MCGFFQVVSKKEIHKQKFQNSLDSISHRGPDATNTIFNTLNINNNTIYCASGHNRLSILDLHTRANQPLVDNQHTLLYNGEIYNFKKLKQKLFINENFTTTSDTEVVFKSLVKDKEIIHQFNGMWAISLLDKVNHSIFLSRDRYGKKPLFYYIDNDTMCISSTIYAIKQYIGLDLKFDQNILENYILHGSMFPSSNEQTHFENIYQILPGHHGYFDLKNWSIYQEQYFNHNEVDPYNNHNMSLKESLQQSVELRMESDRPVALLLSGGIDSSLILSILHATGLIDNVHVFMGDTGRSDDYHYAKQCVKQLGINATTITSDYDTNTFNRFLNICKHHEKPFPFNGNAVAMPQMYEEVAEYDIPVVLDGSGGDEIFGGYWERHIPFAMNDALKNSKFNWIEMMIKENGDKNNVKKSAQKHHLKQNKYKKDIYHMLNPFIKIKPKRIISSDIMDPLYEKKSSFNKALTKDISPGSQLNEWIWHNDRNSMMYSVESRSPFLDINLHKFLFTGYEEKYHGKWNKFELRKVFDKFTPLPTQWRSEKQGFRWDGKHFFINNKDKIIDIISQSTFLDNVVNIPLFISTAKKYPKILRSSLGKRILCVAGIEYSMKD